MTSTEMKTHFDRKFRLAYLIITGSIYGLFLWNFNGIAPYAVIKIPPLTHTEFILRWLFLPLIAFVAIIVNILVSRTFKLDNWPRVLICSIIGFNLSYLLSTILFEILQGDLNRTISFYTRAFKFLPLIIGFANVVIFIVSGVVWLGFKSVSKFVLRQRLP